jgi:hypothetical protein
LFLAYGWLLEKSIKPYRFENKLERDPLRPNNPPMIFSKAPLSDFDFLTAVGGLLAHLEAKFSEFGKLS